MLHFIAGKRLTRTPADRRRRHQRAARGAQAAGRARPRARPVRRWRSCSTCPRRSASSATATGPTATSARTSSRSQRSQLRRSLKGLQREGFRRVWVLRAPEEVEAAEIDAHAAVDGPARRARPVRHHRRRPRLPRRARRRCSAGSATRSAPTGRPSRRRTGAARCSSATTSTAGPTRPRVLRLVMGMAEAGTAICLPGNHDIKLVRKLKGRDVQITHGLAETLEQLAARARGVPRGRARLPRRPRQPRRARRRPARRRARRDEGGLPGPRLRPRARFALYGETTGETDEFGLPVRCQWAADYRGAATVVYGHTPVAEPEWLNNTINIDTGCVFGGALTALRWPERELVSVPARAQLLRAGQAVPAPSRAGTDAAARPSCSTSRTSPASASSRRGSRRTVTVREENAAAALEVMSRFAIDPRWLVYLPPTMSPTATSQRPDVLEHPEEAFAEYRADGVPRVICEEKHMGSRAIVVVCRDAGVGARPLRRRRPARPGALYTRTGRPFLDDARRHRGAPRPRPAGRRRGRAVGRARHRLARPRLRAAAVVGEGDGAHPRPVRRRRRRRRARACTPPSATLEHGRRPWPGRRRAARPSAPTASSTSTATSQAYRRYVWPVDGVGDLRLAPFHVLAAESGVFVDRDHALAPRSLRRARRRGSEWFRRTDRRVVDVTDPAGQDEAVTWWEALTAAGGEGMVVKPMSFVARGRKGLVQPGVKCRGPRVPAHHLRPRVHRSDADRAAARTRRSAASARSPPASSAWASRRSSASCAREPLYRVHECVFAVLALESEPVDPRL